MTCSCNEDQAKLVCVMSSWSGVSQLLILRLTQVRCFTHHATFVSISCEGACRCNADFRQCQVCFMSVSDMHQEYKDRARHIGEGCVWHTAVEMRRHASCLSFACLSSLETFASALVLKFEAAGLIMPKVSSIGTKAFGRLGIKLSFDRTAPFIFRFLWYSRTRRE